MALTISPATSAEVPIARLALVAAAVSGAMLLSALGFEHIGGIRPCDLCHWQRYVHVAVVLFGLGSLATRGQMRVALFWLAMAALLTSAGVALFHAGVELKWWQGPQACTGSIPAGLSPEELRRRLMGTPVVRCDVIAWSMLGLSMAGWNCLLSLLLALGLSATALRRRSTP